MNDFTNGGTATLDAPQQEHEKETTRKVAIICSKGSLDMAYPGLVLANAARMMGIDAVVFFSGMEHDGLGRYGACMPQHSSMMKHVRACGARRPRPLRCACMHVRGQTRGGVRHSHSGP